MNFYHYRIGILVFFVLSMVSCAKITYLDQALTLKAFSEERDRLAHDVAASDARFDVLVERIKTSDPLADLLTDADLVRELGDPLAKLVVADKADYYEWLYRYQFAEPGAKKVYFLLDGVGRVISWRTDGF